MKRYSFHPRFPAGVALAALASMLLMFSCAPRPVPPGTEKPAGPVRPAQTPEPPQSVPEKTLEQPSVPLVQILADEAKKFAARDNYLEALFIYNQAIAQADGEQPLTRQLFEQVENQLIQTPSPYIRLFMEKPGLTIPHSLLLYYLGLKLALENKDMESKPVLASFMAQYPDHPYLAEARSLFDIVSRVQFNRDTIGCLLPLSGKYTVFGERALAGIQLAVKHLSEKFGTNLKVVIHDTQAKAGPAITGVKKMADRNVCAIIGPLLHVEEAGDLAEEYGIPMIALTQKSDFPARGEYLFSNFINPRMQAQTLGTYLFGELGIQNVAILYPDETYGRTYMNLFWDVVNEYGGQIKGVEKYDAQGTDFTTALRKLSGAHYPIPDFLIPEPEPVEAGEPGQEDPGGPEVEAPEVEAAETPVRHARHQEDTPPVEIDFDALFIPDSPAKIRLILPQLAFHDINKVILLGTNLWHHDSLLEKDIRKYTRNSVIADGFFSSSSNPATMAFSDRFFTLFQRRPKFLEAIAHDTASFIFSTAQDEQIDSRQALKDALKSDRLFDGATGITAFDNEGNAHRRLFLMTTKNGRFVEISR